MEFVNEVDEQIRENRLHFKKVAERLAKIPVMEKYVAAIERIFAGNFGHQQADNVVIVEGFITLNLEEGVLPSKEALRNYLLYDLYPGIIYAAFRVGLAEYFSENRGCLPVEHFEMLRETLNNIDFLSINQIPTSIHIEGRGRDIVIHLPLEVTVPGERGSFDNLYSIALFIAENLDRVFEKICSLIEWDEEKRESEQEAGEQ